MPKKTAKPDLRFVVTVDSKQYSGEKPYQRFRADIWIMTGEGLRGVDSYATDNRAPELEYLAITASRDAGKEWYGFETSYFDPFRVTLVIAEDMVKVLRKLQRGMDSLAGQVGTPQTLAGYCAHVALVIGAGRKSFGRRVDQAHDFDGTGFHWMDADALGWWLRQQMTEFDKAHGVTQDADK